MIHSVVPHCCGASLGTWGLGGAAGALVRGGEGGDGRLTLPEPHSVSLSARLPEAYTE